MSKGCDVLKFVILHQFFHNQGSYSNIHWLLIEQHCLEMLHYVTNVTYRKHHCNFLGVAGGGGMVQGFIQALLLTSIFPEGLRFMALGHNPMCICMLTLAAGGSRISSGDLWLFQ